MNKLDVAQRKSTKQLWIQFVVFVLLYVMLTAAYKGGMISLTERRVTIFIGCILLLIWMQSERCLRFLRTVGSWVQRERTK